MVSKASDDLPDPETPVITVRRSWGISSEMFLRLFCRAPSMRRPGAMRIPPPSKCLMVPEGHRPRYRDEPGLRAGSCGPEGCCWSGGLLKAEAVEEEGCC